MGVCLLVVRRAFPGEVPTLEAYARAKGVSTDTLRRAAGQLLRPVCRWLHDRRPGPRREHSSSGATLLALRAFNDLLHAILPKPVVEMLADEAARRRVLDQVRHWRERGVKLDQMATWLRIEARTLRRWIARLKSCGVTRRGRRPHRSPRLLPEEVRIALVKLRRALPDLSVRELTRVFHERCRPLLDEHDIAKVSRKTVAHYTRGEIPVPGAEPKPADPDGSTRGAYVYPPPFAMAWIDTTYFTVAGVSVHIVVTMEAFSRLVFEGEVFVQECSAAAASVIERALARVPGLGALVRDRGKPYLNDAIDQLLARHDCLPINAYKHFPIDKAALERFFGTLKAWLGQALEGFELRCRLAGRAPTRDDVVEVVRTGLRVFLRAYNLLPQPYLEDRCPIERLEAALAKAGPPVDRDALCALAQDRADRDVLLGQLRDALGLRLDLVDLRKRCASISTKGLRATLDSYLEQTLRKDDIRDRLAYLLAIAHKKTRTIAEDDARAKASREQTERLRRREREWQAEQTREDTERRQAPERFLEPDLKAWIQLDHHIPSRLEHLGQGFLAQTLAKTLLDATRKLGAAFDAEFDRLVRLLPDLVHAVRPQAIACLNRILTVFRRLRDGPVHDPPDRPPLHGPHRPGLRLALVNNPARSASGAQVPHVGRTDVCS